MARPATGLTVRARCLLAAGITALACGLILGESDLARAGVLSLVIPLVTLASVHRRRFTFSFARSLTPARPQAGESVDVTLALESRSVLPSGTLILADRLPARHGGSARFVLDGLAPRQQRRVSFQLAHLPRGSYRLGPLDLRLTDPFGMVDLHRTVDVVTPFLVTPIVEPLGGFTLPRAWDAGDKAGSNAIGSAGADDASTREYRYGDDLRKIHWRSSARHASLMVRLEERPWHGAVRVVLDTRISHHLKRPAQPDEHDARHFDSLEWAISAAASICTALIHSDRSVTLHASDTVMASARGEQYILDTLATLVPDHRPDLVHGAAGTRMSQDDTVIAILGRVDSATLRTLEALRPRGYAGIALALVLDTRAWSGQPGHGSDMAAGEAALVGAGWRVSAAHPGDDVATACRRLVGDFARNATR